MDKIPPTKVDLKFLKTTKVIIPIDASVPESKIMDKLADAILF